MAIMASLMIGTVLRYFPRSTMLLQTVLYYCPIYFFFNPIRTYRVPFSSWYPMLKKGSSNREIIVLLYSITIHCPERCSVCTIVYFFSSLSLFLQRNVLPLFVLNLILYYTQQLRKKRRNPVCHARIIS